MPRGVKPKKKTEKPKGVLPKPSGVWVWAQCDNAGCQKWRKLPPGTVIDDNEPWFCYMNPHEDRNDCNIPEEEYNVATEAAIYNQPATDGEALMREDDEAWVPSHEPERQKAALFNGRAGSRSKNGYGAKSSAKRVSWSKPGQGRANSGHLEELHDPAHSMENGWMQAGPAATSVSEGRDAGGNSLQDSEAWLQHTQKMHQVFSRVLSVGGAWEMPMSEGEENLAAPPRWLWEGLAAYAPSEAQLACQAADASSAAQYFEMAGGPEGVPQASEAATTARLALTAAAALAMESTLRIPGIRDAASSLQGGPPEPDGSRSPEAQMVEREAETVDVVPSDSVEPVYKGSMALEHDKRAPEPPDGDLEGRSAHPALGNASQLAGASDPGPQLQGSQVLPSWQAAAVQLHENHHTS